MSRGFFMLFSKKLFSQRLRELRLERGLKQDELGKLVGLKTGSLANLETGRGAPSITVFCALAAFFDVSLDHMAGKNNRPDNPPPWLEPLYPALASLPPEGRKVVKAIVKTFS
jgi:transcriptional regulator with XRE-family HTH domain